MDPLMEEFPASSPYVAICNSPIQGFDPDGKKVFFANSNSKEYFFQVLSYFGLDNAFKIGRNGQLRVDSKWKRQNKDVLIKNPDVSEIFLGLKYASSGKVNDINYGVVDSEYFQVWGYQVYPGDKTYYTAQYSTASGGSRRDAYTILDILPFFFFGMNSQKFSMEENRQEYVIINKAHDQRYYSDNDPGHVSDNLSMTMHLLLDQSTNVSPNNKLKYYNHSRSAQGLSQRSPAYGEYKSEVDLIHNEPKKEGKWSNWNLDNAEEIHFDRIYEKYKNKR